MATGAIQIDEGSTLNLATNTVSEDAVTKHISRSVLNTSAGAEISPLTDTQLRATAVPVSGTVTANLSATDNAVLDDILVDTSAIKTAVQVIDNAISGSEMQVDVVSTALPTGASTSEKQDTGNSSLTSIDGKVPALGQALAAASVPVILPSATITTLTPQTDALTNTQLRATAVPVSATLGAETTKVIGTVNISASQTIAVTNEGTFATQATLQAGSAAIGKLAANSGVDIGDVDVTSLPALTAGTNAIGKLLPPDIDVTEHTNYVKKYYTNAGAVTDGIVWSPAAGKRWHIVSLFVNVSAAATVTFEDDKAGGDEAVLKMELAANSGTVIPFPEKYPLASGEDASDLIITTSAGNVYCTVVGYEI